MNNPIFVSKVKVKNEKLKLSNLILTHSYKVASSFIDSYESLRKTRKSKTGITDEEQDLLRAMLIFATAGLDSMIKQLVKDCYEIIVNVDTEAQSQLEVYTLQRLKQKTGDTLTEYTTDIKFLSKLLSNESPRKTIIKDKIDKLTSGSLQSLDELLKVASAFAISSEKLEIDKDKTKEIFKVRNQIIHEMDIALNLTNRKRIHRNKEEMVEKTTYILKIAENFLKIIDKKIKQN